MTDTLEKKTEIISILKDSEIVAQAILSGNGKSSNVSQSNLLLEGIYVADFEKIKKLAEHCAYHRYGENIEIKYSPVQ